MGRHSSTTGMSRKARKKKRTNRWAPQYYEVYEIVCQMANRLDIRKMPKKARIKRATNINNTLMFSGKLDRYQLSIYKHAISNRLNVDVNIFGWK